MSSTLLPTARGELSTGHELGRNTHVKPRISADDDVPFVTARFLGV